MNNATNSNLSFADRMDALLTRTAYRVAKSAAQRRAIFEMRYECYLREEAIDPNETLLYSDPYDDLPNALLIGVFIDGLLASSIRLHVSNPACPTMPDAGAFPDLIQPMVERGGTIIDVSRFVVGQTASRAFAGLPYLTVRSGWMCAMHHRASHILTATRAEHVAFYRRSFGSDVRSEVRAYPTLKKPVCLLSLDFVERQERVERRYPFFASTAEERQSIFERCDGGADGWTQFTVPETHAEAPAEAH